MFPPLLLVLGETVPAVQWTSIRFLNQREWIQKNLKTSRTSLSDVVKDQVGVDSQEYCANCGAKRLTINGLKGEHTSILVDGLPLHSAVSSFYGVDNIPNIGLSEIQVMRGAGASLTNPEAIGGTLNLITVNPLDFKNSLATSVGVDDKFSGKSQNHNLLLGYKDKNQRWGSVIGGQFSRLETWDSDQNNVAEAPQRQNFSILSKSRLLLGDKNDISFRLNYSQLEILGGPADPTRPRVIAPLEAQELDFTNGSVENEFIGDPLQITDWVATSRREFALGGTHYLNNALTLDWKIGQARQTQEAIYQHGFDYANIDNLLVGDLNFKYFSGDRFIYTFGGFFKDQRLRSTSVELFENPSRNIQGDSFNFSSYSLYSQELTNEISKPVFAPRLQWLHHIGDHLKQRLSYGYGYRAPLTFFESQHGNNENGYQVDIDKLERSHSLVYSMSWNTPNYYLTGGLHYTYLQNMAFGFETLRSPTVYRNSSESYNIGVADLLGGLKVAPWWFLEASAEFFLYEDGYKRKLPTAAIEQRFQIKSTINRGRWAHSLFLNMIGARDLSKYGSYPDHFVDRNQSQEPDLDPNLELKGQRAPFFFTLDASLTYKIHKTVDLSFSINNLFNYTQAGRGDSPATWHWHFVHAHYDNLHTWGPNRGRQFLKIQYRVWSCRGLGRFFPFFNISWCRHDL